MSIQILVIEKVHMAKKEPNSFNYQFDAKKVPGKNTLLRRAVQYLRRINSMIQSKALLAADKIFKTGNTNQ
jgi:hypothetical protein